ncbi:MAG TPA: isochorismatase family cysteine hydrolase [bacterium]|nr:isochorismatase family cysteine hydrolase [bacterium]
MPEARYALLVIDAQNYFFEPASSAYLPASSAIVPRMNRLIAAAVTGGAPVFFTVHRAPTEPGNLMTVRYKRLPSGRECDLWRGISAPPKPILIEKEHYSAFHRTGLAARLRRRGIRDIVLCGAMTHLCVDTTARHGFMLGFKPVVVADACCSKTPAFHRAALLALGHGFAEVTTTQGWLSHAR